jgi:N-acetylmuramic acid 6-phosphate (MurNAc-6-P) etherase
MATSIVFVNLFTVISIEGLKRSAILAFVTAGKNGVVGLADKFECCGVVKTWF